MANHLIEITASGVDDPTMVQLEDTVKWLALGGTNASAVDTTAVVTFTGAVPFKQSLDGPITIAAGHESSTYTVYAKTGKYPYKVSIDGGIDHYSCSIQVVPHGEVATVGYDD